MQCTIISTEFEFGGPSPLGARPQKCGVGLRRWENQRRLSSFGDDFERGCITVKVADDPVTVQLLFEPSGRPADEQNYYINEKDNVCVVCGSDESYIRKNIIPREYRKYVSIVTYMCQYYFKLF